jgi:hypothetical protein
MLERFAKRLLDTFVQALLAAGPAREALLPDAEHKFAELAIIVCALRLFGEDRRGRLC